MTSATPGATPRRRAEETILNEHDALNRRYRLAGWGSLLLWTGAVAFLPGERLPLGLGLLGIGAILLALNLLRRALHELPANPFDTTLGVIALALGAAELSGSLLVVPVAMIALGLVLLVRGMLPSRRKAAAADCCCGPG
jgi:hypothetical protein